jgi:hypothetical protein
MSNRVERFPKILEFVSGIVLMRWGIVRGMVCFVTETRLVRLLLVQICLEREVGARVHEAG